MDEEGGFEIEFLRGEVSLLLGGRRKKDMYLADMIIPFLLSNSYFDRFVHKTR